MIKRSESNDFLFEKVPVEGDYSTSGLLSLDARITVLESDLELLRTHHDSLQINFDNLLTNHNTLQSDFDTLLGNHNTLQTDFDNLLTNHNTLQTDYDALQIAFDGLITQLIGLGVIPAP